MTSAFAQTKNVPITDTTTITWLGLDFSQTKVIDAKEAITITNDQFRDQYTLEWNQLFIAEQKKYDVTKAIEHKNEVSYSLDVTEKANSKLKNKFFTDDVTLYKTLTADKVAAIVKKYNFQGAKGIGLLFFVEGLSKPAEEAGIWVVYVDMKTKKVLLSGYKTAKPEGFGFKNYWAHAFLKVLKESRPKDLK
jgi:hypothetical protein